jgi:purine-binding chemotaxis protein CheW
MAESKKITLYEDDLYEKEETKNKTAKFVVFRVSNEWYGIEILKVKEVATIEKITYLPSSPENVAGIANLRGDILSVTDLKNIFGLPHEETTEKSRLVVIESGDLETGLSVDEVSEVVEAATDKIYPTLTTIPPEKAEYLSGQCRMNNKLIGILNVNKLLK